MDTLNEQALLAEIDRLDHMKAAAEKDQAVARASLTALRRVRYTAEAATATDPADLTRILLFQRSLPWDLNDESTSMIRKMEADAATIGRFTRITMFTDPTAEDDTTRPMFFGLRTVIHGDFDRVKAAAAITNFFTTWGLNAPQFIIEAQGSSFGDMDAWTIVLDPDLAHATVMVSFYDSEVTKMRGTISEALAWLERANDWARDAEDTENVEVDLRSEYSAWTNPTD